MRYSGHMYTGLILALLLKNEMKLGNNVRSLKRLINLIRIPGTLRDDIAAVTSIYERKKDEQEVISQINSLFGEVGAQIEQIKDIEEADKAKIRKALDDDKKKICEIFNSTSSCDKKLQDLKNFTDTFNKRDALYDAIYGPLIQWRKIAFNTKIVDYDKYIKREILLSFIKELLLGIIDGKLDLLKGKHLLDEETKSERDELRQYRKSLDREEDLGFLLPDGYSDKVIRKSVLHSIDIEYHNAYSKVAAFVYKNKKEKYRQTDIAALDECKKSEEDRHAAELIEEKLRIKVLKSDYLLKCYRNKKAVEKDQLPTYIVSDDKNGVKRGNYEYQDYKGIIKNKLIYEHLASLAEQGDYGSYIPYFLLGCVAPDVFRTTRDGHHIYKVSDTVSKEAKKHREEDDEKDSSAKTILRQAYSILIRAIVYARNNDKCNAWLAYGVVVHFVFDALIVSLGSIRDRVNYTDSIKNAVEEIMENYNRRKSAEIELNDDNELTDPDTCDAEIEDNESEADKYANNFHKTADVIMEDLIKRRKDTILNTRDLQQSRTIEQCDVLLHQIIKSFGCLDMDKKAHHCYNKQKLTLRNKDTEIVRFGVYRNIEGDECVINDDPILKIFNVLYQLGVYIKNNFDGTASGDTALTYSDILKGRDKREVTAIFKDIYIHRKPEEIYKFYEEVIKSYNIYRDETDKEDDKLHPQKMSIWDRIRRFFRNNKNYVLTEEDDRNITYDSFIPYLELTLGRRYLNDIFKNRNTDPDNLNTLLDYTYSHLKNSADLGYPDGEYQLANFFLQLKTYNNFKKKLKENYVQHKKTINSFLEGHQDFNNYEKIHSVFIKLAGLDNNTNNINNVTHHHESIIRLCSLYINPPNDSGVVFQVADKDNPNREDKTRLNTIAQCFEYLINDIKLNNKNKYKYQFELAKIYERLGDHAGARNFFENVANSNGVYSAAAHFKLGEYRLNALDDVDNSDGNTTSDELYSHFNKVIDEWNKKRGQIYGVVPADVYKAAIKIINHEEAILECQTTSTDTVAVCNRYLFSRRLENIINAIVAAYNVSRNANSQLQFGPEYYKKTKSLLAETINNNSDEKIHKQLDEQNKELQNLEWSEIALKHNEKLKSVLKEHKTDEDEIKMLAELAEIEKDICKYKDKANDEAKYANSKGLTQSSIALMLAFKTFCCLQTKTNLEQVKHQSEKNLHSQAIVTFKNIIAEVNNELKELKEQTMLKGRNDNNVKLRLFDIRSEYRKLRNNARYHKNKQKELLIQYPNIALELNENLNNITKPEICNTERIEKLTELGNKISQHQSKIKDEIQCAKSNELTYAINPLLLTLKALRYLQTKIFFMQTEEHLNEKGSYNKAAVSFYKIICEVNSVLKVKDEVNWVPTDNNASPVLDLSSEYRNLREKAKSHIIELSQKMKEANLTAPYSNKSVDHVATKLDVNSYSRIINSMNKHSKFLHENVLNKRIDYRNNTHEEIVTPKDEINRSEIKDYVSNTGIHVDDEQQSVILTARIENYESKLMQFIERKKNDFQEKKGVIRLKHLYESRNKIQEIINNAWVEHGNYNIRSVTIRRFKRMIQGYIKKFEEIIICYERQIKNDLDSTCYQLFNMHDLTHEQIVAYIEVLEGRIVPHHAENHRFFPEEDHVNLIKLNNEYVKYLRGAVLNEIPEEIDGVSPAATNSALQEALSKGKEDRSDSGLEFVNSLKPDTLDPESLPQHFSTIIVSPSGVEALHNSENWHNQDNRVSQDYDEQVDQLRKAAEQGDLDAQFRFAICYEQGNGVPQDDKEAALWFKKASEQGYDLAQYKLGNCYIQGTGVPQDDKEAVMWFKKAAEQGNARGQYNLGVCYKWGRGVPQDDKEAAAWFEKAARQGHPVGQYKIGECYYNGTGVPRNYTHAVVWYTKAAKQGIVTAQRRLGLCYRYGIGVSRDLNEGVKWFRKAAEQGDKFAIDALKELLRE